MWYKSCLFTRGAGGFCFEPLVDVETGVVVETEGGLTAPLIPSVLHKEAWTSLTGLSEAGGGESGSIGEMDRERRGVVCDLIFVVSFSSAVEKKRVSVLMCSRIANISFTPVKFFLHLILSMEGGEANVEDNLAIQECLFPWADGVFFTILGPGLWSFLLESLPFFSLIMLCSLVFCPLPVVWAGTVWVSFAVSPNAFFCSEESETG